MSQYKNEEARSRIVEGLDKKLIMLLQNKIGIEAVNSIQSHLIGCLRDELIEALLTIESLKTQQQKSSGIKNPMDADGSGPPHYVVASRLQARRDSGKHYYHLRRSDNDKWLWSSPMFSNHISALRETHEAAERFGWEIIDIR